MSPSSQTKTGTCYTDQNNIFSGLEGVRGRKGSFYKKRPFLPRQNLPSSPAQASGSACSSPAPAMARRTASMSTTALWS